MTPAEVLSKRAEILARTSPAGRLAIVKGQIDEGFRRLADVALREARSLAAQEPAMVQRFHRALVPELGDKAPGEHPDQVALEPLDERALVTEALEALLKEHRTATST